MNFTECHLLRDDTIRTHPSNNDMSDLLPLLKTLAPHAVRFVSITPDGQAHINDSTAFFTEDELDVSAATLFVYLGTSTTHHYVAVVSPTAPAHSQPRPIRQCMTLPLETCDVLGFAVSLVRFNTVSSFCVKCGGALAYSGFGTHKRCSACSSFLFPRTDPCIIVIVKHPSERKCLLVRKQVHRPHFYTCIAGFLELGEGGEACVRREVFEETGIRVGDVRYVTSQAYPINATNQLMLGYIAQATSDTIDIGPGNELQDAFWADHETVGHVLEEAMKDHPESLHTVPPTYIAHQLIRYWYTHSE